MDNYSGFEAALFCRECSEVPFVSDLEFIADRLIELPSVRPFLLERAVTLCYKHCNNAEFRHFFLERSFNCPVLLHRMFKKNAFEFSEIEPNILGNQWAYILCYYFRNEIKDFDKVVGQKVVPDDFDHSFIENVEDLEKLIEFGFLPNSTEYCLKYDDIKVFKSKFDLNERKAKWSPFEWSYKPKSLDLLSFSGFFGSIHCFKFLLLNDFEINKNVISSIACSGNSDIFHLCQYGESCSSDCLFMASKFCHLDTIKFLLDNGANLTSKNRDEWTSLHFAAEQGHISVVEYLMNQGSDANEFTDENYTSLHYAAGFGHHVVVEYLYINGSNVNVKGFFGETPLLYAGRMGFLRIVEYLANHGGNLNDKDGNEWNLLHYAATYSCINIIEYCIKHGVNVNSKENNSTR